MADMDYHIISIQKSFLSKYFLYYTFSPKMHEMVLMLFLVFHASLKFKKILLCYLIQVGDFGLKHLTLLFLHISKSSAHPFSAKATKCNFLCGELKSKNLKLGMALPNVIFTIFISPL
jgi:hypothetical protein